MRQRLTETPGDDVHPLDIHGRRVIDCHEQLVGILRNRLGQNHADFFAQPALTAGSRAIVWYTSVPGEVAAVDCASARRAAASHAARRAHPGRRGRACRADRVRRTRRDEPWASFCRAAAQVAPGAPLFSVGGKVVAVLWGHRSANAPRAHGPVSSVPEPLPVQGPVHGTTQNAVSGAAIGTHTAENAKPQRPAWIVPALVALVAVALARVGMAERLAWPARGAGR